MPVSVVIASTLDSRVLDRCVEAAVRSAAAVGPGAEVLLVANRVRGGRLPRVNSPLLRVLRSSPDGTATARNTGIAAARHDTILFTDDDLVVPPSWCGDLHAALHGEDCGGGDCAAVGAPVRTVVAGPVTSFMNYERVFNAPPVDARYARTLVTANAGYRRDLAAPGTKFNAERHQFFAQDTEFALTLADQGIAVRWLPDIAPSMHYIDEDIATVAVRAIKNGRGAARIYLARGLVHNYLPAPHTVYEGFRTGSYKGYRRYREIDSVEIRAVYATLNLIRHALMFAGYLTDIGTSLGHELIELDQDGLLIELRSLVDGLGEVIARVPDEAWHDVPVRLRRDMADAPAIDHLVPVQAIADVLSRFAAPTWGPARRTSARPPISAELFQGVVARPRCRSVPNASMARTARFTVTARSVLVCSMVVILGAPLPDRLPVHVPRLARLFLDELPTPAT